jgi:hypothetical protein
VTYPGRIDSSIISRNNVFMGKRAAFCAGPKGEVDIRKAARSTRRLSTDFSCDEHGIPDIFSIPSADGRYRLCTIRDQASENVREARRYKRFPADNIEILGEISFADKAEIENISENGVLLKVHKKMDIGKKYTLKICCKEKKIVMKAFVVWSLLSEARRTSTDQIIPIYMTGMEFKDIWNEHKKILRNLIRQIEASTELIHSCQET